MNKIHDVQKISFTGTTMKLHIDEKEYEIELGQYSKRLVDATQNKEKSLLFLHPDMEFIGPILTRIFPLPVCLQYDLWGQNGTEKIYDL